MQPRLFIALQLTKSAARGDMAAKLLNKVRFNDPTWVRAKEPGFGHFMQAHLPERDLDRINGFKALTPNLDFGSMSPHQLGQLPSDASAGLATRLRSLRLANRFNVPRVKLAASAPQTSAGGVGGGGLTGNAPQIAKQSLGGGTQPFASQMHNWTDSIAKNPIMGAMADPTQASGGLQAMAASQQGQTTAGWLDQFKKSMQGWGRRAHY